MSTLRKHYALALVPESLLIGAIWGLLWFSAVHALPYFYIVAAVFDIVAYGLFGLWVYRSTESVGLKASFRAPFGVLAMALFYTGNRLIWLGWLAGSWPFSGGGWPSWIFMAWEMLVIAVGLVAATGAWKTLQSRSWDRWGTRP